jgi:ubiquinone/menaquinone biosynthesis C-methylase UbiE
MQSPDTTHAYNCVADEYALRIYDELKDKPFDREMLNRLAEGMPSGGTACDLGCGPGQVARHLRDRGARVIGLDLSTGMLVQAMRLNPGIPFAAGDMLALPVADGSLAAIAAFYSIIHLLPHQHIPAFREMHRVLAPGGKLLVSFHIGEETRHLDEWWGHNVSIDFQFLMPQTIAETMATAGFAIDGVIEREPYPEVEHPSRRAYILATR